MNKVMLLLAIGMLAVSCEDQDGCIAKEYFFRSCVNSYHDGDLSIHRATDNTFHYPLFLRYFFRGGESRFYCSSPEVSRNPTDPERFLEIAERNGDRSYDRKETVATPDQIRGAYAKNFRAVHVVCLNTAWDEAHPAGSSLDELTWIRHGSYAPYVRSGYKLARMTTHIDKRLSDLAEDDLSMLTDSSGIIYFTTLPPAPGTYRLQVTFLATDGTQKTGVCEFTWDPASIDPAEG